ncbi:MAG: hypothetical protein WBB45_19255 [Cyclobacteriaceae bacterium]
MKRMPVMIVALGLFFTTTSFTYNEEGSCTSYTETGYVIEKLGCYYRVDLGYEIRLVPSSGVSMTPGNCYTFDYDICGFQCGNGGVTSATLLSYCP